MSKSKPKGPTKPKLFRVTSTAWESFFDAESLEEAQLYGKWNYMKGYEISTILSNTIVERHEHFCPSCRKCSCCNHLYSEHFGEDNRPRVCTVSKCKCRDFTFPAEK